MLYFLQKKSVLFVWDIIASNLVNVRSLIRRYWWEKSLKLINVRRTFIRHLRVGKETCLQTSFIRSEVGRLAAWIKVIAFSACKWRQLLKSISIFMPTIFFHSKIEINKWVYTFEVIKMSKNKGGAWTIRQSWKTTHYVKEKETCNIQCRKMHS